jgi:hypothetical protein
MPQLGLGLRANVSGISFYDGDASAYFTRAGVTDATAKAQINEFVKGVKAFGLWNSMVCWPLRSAQNAGAGATAYSLGGLQTANATLVNGSTWTANGTPFTTSQYANATISDPGQDITLLLVAAGSGANFSAFPHFFGVQNPSFYYNGEIFLGEAGGSATSLNTLVVNSSGYYPSIAVQNGLSGSTSFRFISGSSKPNTLINVKRLDISSEAGGTPASSGTVTLTRMQLNGRWAGAVELAQPTTCAFCAVIAPNISGSESSVYTLYKNTIGSGLGLP